MKISEKQLYFLLFIIVSLARLLKQLKICEKSINKNNSSGLGVKDDEGGQNIYIAFQFVSFPCSYFFMTGSEIEIFS